MATFSGRNSPTALAALAPSITNLAAAKRAKSQAAAGLMNTLGVQFEKQKQQTAKREQNEAAQQVAEKLLQDPAFRRQAPGITDSASLVKLVGAENVIEYGMKTQQADRIAQESSANIGLIKARMNDFERQKEDREAAKASAKALQGLLPTAINLEVGADTKDVFEKAAQANLTPTDYATLANTISSRTGLDAQVVSAELERQKALTGATKGEIASGKLLSEVTAGIATGAVKNIDEVTNLDEFTVEQQGKIFSAFEKKNPTAPKAIPIPNPNNPEEILGYAMATGNGNYRIVDAAKSGDGLSPGVQANIAALKARTRLDPGDPNYITQEQFEKARGESLRTASLIQDQSGLDRDPAALDDGPDADVPISDLNSELSIGIAQRLSGLTSIISETGEINMQELDKALAMLKSSAELDDRNISEIMRMLKDTANDRRAAADQREKSRNMDRSMIDIEMGPERVAEREEILRRVSRGPSFPGAIGF